MLNTSLHRYTLSSWLYTGYLSSKTLQFKSFNYKLAQIFVMAGLYKLNSILPEHGMILSSLTARPSILNYQLHGKRQKKTTSISTVIFNKAVWLFLDKFIHEFISHMYEFSTPKSKKYRKTTNFYSLRIRQKLTNIEEFSDIIENSMYDTHKGIYLPLTLHFKLSQIISNTKFELYLRMIRLPINLFKRMKRPAFDDKIVLVGMDYLYREYKFTGKGGQLL
jgi:hypothetical protein